jgi:quercetin dioxygenase-like cupin family protein
VDLRRHPAPHKQYVVCLDGGVQIEVSKPAGDTRVFQPGSVFYVEDTHGRGHKSSSVNGEIRRSIFIQADDG